jgi:hypothetical protein
MPADVDIEAMLHRYFYDEHKVIPVTLCTLNIDDFFNLCIAFLAVAVMPTFTLNVITEKPCSLKNLVIKGSNIKVHLCTYWKGE